VTVAVDVAVGVAVGVDEGVLVGVTVGVRVAGQTPQIDEPRQTAPAGQFASDAQSQSPLMQSPAGPQSASLVQTIGEHSTVIPAWASGAPYQVATVAATRATAKTVHDPTRDRVCMARGSVRVSLDNRKCAAG
jgi:hypothetical protein